MRICLVSSTKFKQSHYDMDAYWFPHLTGPSLDLELLPYGLTTLGLLKKWLSALQSVSESPQSKENGEHQPRIDAVLEGHNKIRDIILQQPDLNGSGITLPELSQHIRLWWMFDIALKSSWLLQTNLYYSVLAFLAPAFPSIHLLPIQICFCLTFRATALLWSWGDQ